MLLLTWKLRLLFRTSCVFYVTEMAAVYCMALKASLWSYLVYASVMAGGFGRCLYLQKSICIGGGLHGKQCQGEITPHLFRRKAAGYFSSGAFRSSRYLSDRKQVQGNVLRPVCACTGPLAEHRVRDWMISCYCLIVIGIIKVINWLLRGRMLAGSVLGV